MSYTPDPKNPILSISSRPVYGRLSWLDELRFVAIALMVVDHALLFFAPADPIAGLVRCTLTRCAEPLFVFVLTTVTIFLRRPVRPSRWFQIAAISLATSGLLSVHLGYPVADVLVSLSIAVLTLPFLLRVGGRVLTVSLYGAAALCMVPVSLWSVTFDYSPILIVYQMLLTRLLYEKSATNAAMHGLLSGFVALLSGCLLVGLGAESTGSVLTICFGHPVAVLLIVAVRGAGNHRVLRAAAVARSPLAIYACHLAVFAGLANCMEVWL